MSLPLSRRIAQAALLVAAGATPLVVAGSASADQLVPKGTDFGSGISKLDGVTSASTLKGETHQVGQALGTTGSVLSGTAVPAAADVTGTAASQALPQTDRVVPNLSDPAGATTAGGGPLADTVAKLSTLTPLGGMLPGATPRAMPQGAMPLMEHGALPAGPAMPSVSGLDKVLNPQTLGNPLGATGRLTQQIPATNSLSGQLPSQDRVLGAVPAADSLDQVPATAPLADALPATHGLSGNLAGLDQLGHALPAADLDHPAAAADAAHLDELHGQAMGATHRLGGLPDLSGVLGQLTGAAGGLNHLPSVG
ncbi:hypothetical protein C7C46_26185 [Streptomyces tateyamensis]|uniref:ATP-binding protein n=1 Tax=Streptomyces tateyamensis TaxID=565073 RepID=A0A2V4N7K6_9ACTN|nr:hypothetical protein [Streptomyces tateyamensis]PYC72127.1 hypothetical protein C7C46_26185 [Streptomyces tateyamensis]